MSPAHAVSGAARWGVPAAAALLAAAILATNSNAVLFVWINSWSRTTGTIPWPYVTILGDTAVALALVAPLAVRRADIAWALALSALLGTLFVHGFKPLLEVPRPPAVFASEAITVIGPRYTANSFPSGHTTTIFLAAGLVWLHFGSPVLRSVTLLLAIAVGLSRAVVGVHWPLDIAAGAGLGWLAAVLGTACARRFAGGTSRPVHVALATVTLGCAVALLAGSKTGYPRAVQLQYAIGSWGLLGAMASWIRAIRPPDPAAAAPPGALLRSTAISSSHTSESQA